MASMRDIKRRKSSIQSTQQITKAMKLVSTVKLQKAKNRAEQTNPYFQYMYRTVTSMLAKSGTINHPYLKKGESDKKAVVVITSNRGLAGGYNSNIVKLVFDVTVTDPSKIVISGTLAAGDYAGFSINFADYADAIEPCIGLSVDEFSKQVKNSGDARGDSSITPTIAMYPVKEDGTWDETSEYTANGLGYWFDGKSNVSSYGDNCVYFIESGEGSVFVGRYVNIASGTTIKAHFVYAMIEDHSRYVEFIVSGTME